MLSSLAVNCQNHYSHKNGNTLSLYKESRSLLKITSKWWNKINLWEVTGKILNCQSCSCLGSKFPSIATINSKTLPLSSGQCFAAPTQAHWKMHEQRMRQLQCSTATAITVIHIWLCLELETYFYEPLNIFVRLQYQKLHTPIFAGEQSFFFLNTSPWNLSEFAQYQSWINIGELPGHIWWNIMTKSIITIKIYNHHPIIYICLR